MKDIGGGSWVFTVKMGKSILLSILLVVSYMSTFTTVLGDNMELETVDVDLLHDPGANLTMTFTTTTNLSINPGNLSIEELMKLELAEYPLRDPLSIAIPMTLIYSLILLSGLVGNVSTCIVIAKISYMHTATNYYLFSLAMSDLLLLTSGVPQICGHRISVERPLAFSTVARYSDDNHHLVCGVVHGAPTSCTVRDYG
ncbi:Neuromedin-U receptor 2 [Folsomia candida]|uniref:Neuromedin-U receptor 2 n=1 Tax=Folsomia candida TaxID=158441 RepID=A0A226DLU1_FOLCA|nr:Neuromedin-U receptor 2 [Folsomia candida]